MLTNLPSYLAYIRKAIVNTVGLATSLLSLGLLPAPYAAYVATGVAIATALLHYQVSNADAPGTTPAVEPFDSVAEDEDEDAGTPAEWQPAPVATAQQEQGDPEAEIPLYSGRHSASLLAKGGIVGSPSLAVIGEAGHEHRVPSPTPLQEASLRGLAGVITVIINNPEDAAETARAVADRIARRAA